ncbi:MAG: hypothetical protein JKY94_02725 [Rhodobacteraceae bacterium]|nr:hypothetical protein [Paracoccaceae bacterium]
MRHFMIPFAVAMALAASEPAQAAECYADYKAKQDSPLRLHYGVLQLNGACARGPAQSEVAARLETAGWTLLNVLSVFGPEGLNERKDDAGPNFLRF